MRCSSSDNTRRGHRGGGAFQGGSVPLPEPPFRADPDALDLPSNAVCPAVNGWSHMGGLPIVCSTSALKIPKGICLPLFNSQSLPQTRAGHCRKRVLGITARKTSCYRLSQMLSNRRISYSTQTPNWHCTSVCKYMIALVVSGAADERPVWVMEVLFAERAHGAGPPAGAPGGEGVAK
jgi:hypothetical protein